MKEKIEKFVSFYRSQDLARRREIRDAFLQRAGVSYPGWGSKLTRKHFTKLELEALNDICNYEGGEIPNSRNY